MAVTFPSSPTTNQQVTDSVTGAVWQWDGTKWVALNSGQIYLPISNPTYTGILTGPTELLPGNLSSTLLFGSNTTTPYAGWSVPNAGSSLITAGCHWNASGNLIADATSGTQFSMGSSSNGFTFWVGQGTWTVGSQPSSALLGIATINNAGLNITNGNLAIQQQTSPAIAFGAASAPTAAIDYYTPPGYLQLSYGSYNNGTNWVANYAGAVIVNIGGTATAPGVTFFANAGLTVGNTYTPTNVLTIGTSQVTSSLNFVTTGGFWAASSNTTTGTGTQYTNGSLQYGTYYNGTNWVANVAAPALCTCTGGVWDFYVDTGKTVGSTYTPTLIAYFNSSGLTVGTGGFLSNGNINTNGNVMAYGGVYYGLNTSTYLQAYAGSGAVTNWQIVTNGGSGSYAAFFAYGNTGCTVSANLAVNGGGINLAAGLGSGYYVARTSAGLWQFVENGTSIFNVNANGAGTFANTLQCGGIGLQTTLGAHWHAFYWNGTQDYVQIDNATGWLQLTGQSDERLKEHIGPSTFDCLAAVREMPLEHYRWKSSGVETPIGFVAQHLYRTFPYGVNKGDDDNGEDLSRGELPDEANKRFMWGLDTSPMLAVLAGAIQQLAAKIETLEARLSAGGL